MYEVPQSEGLPHHIHLVIVTIEDAFAVIGRAGIQIFHFQGADGGQVDRAVMHSSACLQLVPWESHGTSLSPIWFICKMTVSTLQAVLSVLKINGNEVSGRQLVPSRWQ